MYFMQNMQNSIMHKSNKGQSVWDCPYIKENMKLRFFDKKKTNGPSILHNQTISHKKHRQDFPLLHS